MPSDLQSKQKTASPVLQVPKSDTETQEQGKGHVPLCQMVFLT